MKELRFRLELPRDEALRYYQGQASTVIARASNGQTIRFPAQHIRPFINAAGVSGVFRIRFDDNNKLIALDRVGD